MDRRQFLIGAMAGIASAHVPRLVASDYQFSRDPFTLGIASGDVSDDAVVLWTRLAPEPLAESGGVGPVAVPVRWEIAKDPLMSKVIQRGESLAEPDFAHSVHIDVRRLEPNSEYWYRFSIGDWTSQTGRTKTLPARSRHTSGVRFVTTSCQNYTHGEFLAYEHIIAEQPDFVIHLGDYIYDTSFGESYRQHESQEIPVTLEAFRKRHALYKTDQQLQRAHAALPFFTIIDNHDATEDRDLSASLQRAAAYQAWYEHMPVRGYRSPGDNHFDLKRLIPLGDLAQISLLDTRQFRDKKDLCGDTADTNLGFGNYRTRCDDLFDDSRTMLGKAQEDWLSANLIKNTAAWNVIASSGPLLPFRIHVDETEYGYIGAWDAYPANRARLVDALSRATKGHPLVLSGDMHSFWALDGELFPHTDERIPLVEFVSSSISANWPEPLSRPVRESLVRNPQIQLYDGDHRGYLVHNVTHDRWQTTYRAVETVKETTSSVFDLETFVLKHGEPSMQRLN